jgi:hypothetical protein
MTAPALRPRRAPWFGWRSPSCPRRRGAAHGPLRLEALEDRCVPAVDVVTSASGSVADVGSLPFEVANAAPGDTVVFSQALAGQTITLASTLEIARDVTIDGQGNGITVSGGGTLQAFLIDSGATVNINGLTIASGRTIGSGAGIGNDGFLSLSNSTVTGNSAGNGAGIANRSTMIMNNDTVSANFATVNGGGIFNQGSLTMANSTVSGNGAGPGPAVASGGGINNAGQLSIANSTIASNGVAGFGASGGGIENSGTLNLLNTILFNPNGASTTPDVDGTVNQSQSSLFGSAVRIATDLGGNQQNANPNLGPLQNNGGTTATMALLPGSPAIAQGAAASQIAGLAVPAFDQRGVPRPAAGIDIGAVQTSMPLPLPPPPPPSASGGSSSSSASSAVDANRISFDALLAVDGFESGNVLLVFFALSDYHNMLGKLSGADQAQAQQLFGKFFFNDIYLVNGLG